MSTSKAVPSVTFYSMDTLFLTSLKNLELCKLHEEQKHFGHFLVSGMLTFVEL